MRTSLPLLSVVILRLTIVLGYNVETAINDRLYLRNGAETENLGSETVEPAYAGYTFDVKMNNNVTNIFVGQPRSGRVNATTSPGALYYCEFSYSGNGIMVTNTTFSEVITTPVPVGDNSSDGITAENKGSQSAFSSPKCNNVMVATDTGINHVKKADALGLSLARRPESNEFTVCTELRQRICPNKDSWAPGACYIGDPTRNDWAIREWDEVECFDKKIEIVFVVDGSGSIKIHNFTIVKQWLVNVTTSLYNEFGDSVRMEVLQYSDKDPAYKKIPIEDSEKFVIPFTLNEIECSIDCMRDGIENMKYLQSQTYTAYALDRVISTEFKKSDWYDVSEKVIIVLTDGAANDGSKLMERYNQAQELNISSYAVGVGNYGSYLTQLRTIANGNKNNDGVYTVDNFGGLQSVISNLTNSITGGGLEGGVNADNNATSDVSNAQTGSSISYGEDGATYLGAVGANRWTGNVIKYDNEGDNTADIPPYSEVQSVLQNLIEASYMGYSVTTGFFEGPGTVYVATGAPRYHMMGAVVIYEPITNSVEFHNSITLVDYSSNRKLGSYFGHSLLAVDVNADGKDDLLVGAPLFVESYDEGRVYVYVSQASGSLRIWESESYKPVELYGDNLPGGRFGLALAHAGDLNGDGYNDIIIGAPLTEDGKGAVFVYHGKSDGIEVIASQKILASELAGVEPKYFGQSLQGNIDLDGNQYPDIVVGAPRSDSVYILRSRPIARIYAWIDFTISRINAINCIEKKYKNCTELRACFVVNGTSVENDIGLTYNISLDSNYTNVREKRLEFRTDPDSTASGIPTTSKRFSIQKGKQICHLHNVYVKQNILDDEDKAITATMAFDLQTEHVKIPMSSVRDPHQSTTSMAEIELVKDCKNEDQCEYDLQISAQMLLPSSSLTDKVNNKTSEGEILVISSSTATMPVIIRVNLTNNGDIAVKPLVNLTFPSKLSLSTLAMRSSYPPSNSCIVTGEQSSEKEDGTKVQTYHYNNEANVMQRNFWCYFEISVITENLRSSGSSGEFAIKIFADSGAASRSSMEKNYADNSWAKSTQVKYQSDFSLKKKSVNAEITFNHTVGNKQIISVDEIGENTSAIAMEFEIKGAGYSNIPMSQIRLRWPSKTAAGKRLLYLYSLNCLFEGGARCSCNDSKVNPDKLMIAGEHKNDTEGPTNTVNVTQSSVLISEPTFDCYTQLSLRRHLCDSLVCNITNLQASGKIYFTALFRLWTSSLTYNKTVIPGILLRSRFDMSTDLSPFVIDSEGNQITLKTQEISTTAEIYSTPVIITKQDTLWIYILSGVGGLLALAAIIVILWKVGFFKRKKFADMQTQEARSDLVDESGEEFPEAEDIGLRGSE